jgi:hypothetical protein
MNYEKFVDKYIYGYLQLYEYPYENKFIYSLKNTLIKNYNEYKHEELLDIKKKIIELYAVVLNIDDNENFSYKYKIYEENINKFNGCSNDDILDKMKIIKKYIKNEQILKIFSNALCIPEIHIDHYYYEENNNNYYPINKIKGIHGNLFGIVTNNNVLFNQDIFNFEMFENILKKTYDLYDDYVLNILKLNINKNESYMHKIFVNSSSQIILFGDIHASLQSFIRSILRLIKKGYMDGNLILKSNCYIIFIGDMINKGIYNCEILYIFCYLKINNFDKVYMTRGNHEFSNEYVRKGTMNEIYYKFKNNGTNILNMISNIFEKMPVIIYINNDDNIIQICHGGFYNNINLCNFLNDNHIHSKIISDNISHITKSMFGKCDNNDNNNGIKINYKFSSHYSPTSSVLKLSQYGLSALIGGHQDSYNNAYLTYYNFNKDCNTTIFGWNILYEKRKKIFSMFMPSKNEDFKIKFPIPIKNSITTSALMFFPSIYKTSTAMSSKILNNDSFCILVFKNQ